MSGPKCSQAELMRIQQERLEKERRLKAEEEARRRRQEEERQRLARVEALKKQSTTQTQAVAAQIKQQESAIYTEDATKLDTLAQELLKSINQAKEESELQSVPQKSDNIRQSLNQAISRKRRDDEAKKRREELEKQKFELEELKRQVSQIPVADASKFDDDGRLEVEQKLSTLQTTIAQGNPEAVSVPLANAIKVVDDHAERVAANRAKWQKRKALAEEAKGEIDALIAGLKADEVVMRWLGDSVKELEDITQKAAQHIAAEEFEQPGVILTNVQSQEKVIVQESNKAQLKADQRDYIALSLKEILLTMFDIVTEQDEDPGNPNTAKTLRAVSVAGNNFIVNVPCEGKVVYDAYGIENDTVCGTAQEMIGNVHSKLLEEHGVVMSPLDWEGKDEDPLRQTHSADELPHNERESSRGAGS